MRECREVHRPEVRGIREVNDFFNSGEENLKSSGRHGTGSVAGNEGREMMDWIWSKH